MPGVPVQLTLPESLAREAESLGLLSPEAVERMLREAMRRQQADKVLALGDRLAEDGTPPLTAEQIDAQIQVARADRRSRHAGGA